MLFKFGLINSLTNLFDLVSYAAIPSVKVPTQRIPELDKYNDFTLLTVTPFILEVNPVLLSKTLIPPPSVPIYIDLESDAKELTTS